MGQVTLERILKLWAMTVSRYLAAGGMTVAGIPFYKNMGVHWTLTILGCISAIMVPVPYVFYRYGPVIRGWSRYAVAEAMNYGLNE